MFDGFISHSHAAYDLLAPRLQSVSHGTKGPQQPSVL